MKVSPIRATLVLELLLAWARTSENMAESCAASPKAVRASVTISEVDARSSPDAAARFMIPGRPATISFAFQPAMAMYSSACPASVAENCVVRPISWAAAFNMSISDREAWEIACTVLICFSNEPPYPKDTATAALIPAAAAFADFTIPLKVRSAALSNALRPLVSIFENARSISRPDAYIFRLSRSISPWALSTAPFKDRFVFPEISIPNWYCPFLDAILSPLSCPPDLLHHFHRIPGKPVQLPKRQAIIKIKTCICEPCHINTGLSGLPDIQCPPDAYM